MEDVSEKTENGRTDGRMDRQITEYTILPFINPLWLGFCLYIPHFDLLMDGAGGHRPPRSKETFSEFKGFNETGLQFKTRATARPPR